MDTDIFLTSGDLGDIFLTVLTKNVIFPGSKVCHGVVTLSNRHCLVT